MAADEPDWDPNQLHSGLKRTISWQRDRRAHGESRREGEKERYEIERGLG